MHFQTAIYREKTTQRNTDADMCGKAAKFTVKEICSVKRDGMQNLLLK